ncbi:hypothetical protein DICPUDRAFT_81177 [Dictyostelium purpureum]|uniref:ComC supersandwich domain-containing protein n=1 Tax=Dictyostelium purpureum TaxID=5786 RepID=F0ZSQ6_DICPU|nr:uncharacterized protein DICPUDRAFT_81177 [Dictyostelium purpureum]EGC33019.1 hypothetical protein DICPUDRAFT_81177 [Dictyostelium purpureum]|eukprot:XP_003290446.1 hypothetical protein DICPUDRAFT_81177 [Dictyostelium purpureum]
MFSIRMFKQKELQKKKIINALTWNYIDLYLPPSVLSASPSFYGTPKDITIKGESFCFYPNVTIGGICSFNSDVDGLTKTHRVTVSCPNNIPNSNSVGSGDVFMYSIDECVLSKSFNGQVCSGNGTCIEETRKCNSKKGNSSFDCSIIKNGQINPPIIDNITSIIETKDSKFDIGLAQIREIDIINNVIKVYNLTTSTWKLENIANENTEQLFNTTLGNNAVIKVLLTINSNEDQEMIYDFYGDKISLLPNSVKYQVEISNWNFHSSVNSLQLIFQTQISTEQCGYQTGKQSVQMYGDSIRSVKLTLVNGQTLVGTFSNRMKIDDRVIKSDIKVLTEEESKGIPSVSIDDSKKDSDKKKSIQNVYSAILISNFKKSVIIDPNFGVLINGNPTISGSCGKKFESWKIALCVVVPVVAFAVVVVLVSIYRRKTNSITLFKLKRLI